MGAWDRVVGGVSGAMSGAAMGMQAGGPWGALAGAVGGAGVGAYSAGGGGGGGGIGLPGSDGFRLQNDAMTAQMNLSNNIAQNAQQQFAQESPYRGNMLNMLQQRAGAQAPVFSPSAPQTYNPFNNTYRVAPTHGPAGAPRGREGFSGQSAWEQVGQPAQGMSAYNPSAGPMQPIGQALEGQYQQYAEQPPRYQPPQFEAPGRQEGEAPGRSQHNTELTDVQLEQLAAATKDSGVQVNQGSMMATNNAMGGDMIRPAEGRDAFTSYRQQEQNIPEPFRGNNVFSATPGDSRNNANPTGQVWQDAQTQTGPSGQTWQTRDAALSTDPRAQAFGTTTADTYGMSWDQIAAMRDGQRQSIDVPVNPTFGNMGDAAMTYDEKAYAPRGQVDPRYADTQYVRQLAEKY